MLLVCPMVNWRPTRGKREPALEHLASGLEPLHLEPLDFLVVGAGASSDQGDFLFSADEAYWAGVQQQQQTNDLRHEQPRDRHDRGATC